jgi:hypothetical protein
MIEVPKLVVILVIGVLVWYGMRWLKRLPSNPRTGAPPRAAGGAGAAGARQRQAGAPQRAVEDLVACPKCGTYVTSGAGCGKPGCPQPR